MTLHANSPVATCPHAAMATPTIDRSWSRPHVPDIHNAKDSDVLCDVENWMKSRLPCVAGRREYSRGKYMIRMATRKTVPTIFSEFKQALEANEAVACLYIFNAAEFGQDQADVKSAFRFLAEQMEPISKLPAHNLANGEPLTNEIELTCPITGKKTMFDDFECIAFCPQSNDPDDPLYDPLMAMPYPAVNMSSDVFAFSQFVAQGVEKMLGKPAWQINDLDALEKVMHRCVGRWQRVATATIDKYESLTDTSLCPVHVTSGSEQWIAGHKDPAFAEVVKEVHSHELPVLYGKRIVDNWMRHFRDGVDYSATGLARDGLPA